METVLIYWFPGLSSSRDNSCSSDPHYVETPTLKPQSGGQPQTNYIYWAVLWCYPLLSARGFFQRQNDSVCPFFLCNSGSTRRLSIPSTYQWHWPCWSREFETEQPSTRPEKHCCAGLSCGVHFDHGSWVRFSCRGMMAIEYGHLRSVEAIYGSQISLRQFETSFNILNGFPVLDDAKSCSYRHLREMGIYFQAKGVIFRVFHPRNDVFYQPNYGFTIFYRDEMMEITVNLMLGFDVWNPLRCSFDWRIFGK